ncbi:MAG: helix-turn-helix domain-containing protein [Chitinispirillaceae bacterium]
MYEENSELKLAFGFLQNTSRNIFLTGKAGTGKTTFLRKLRENSPKRMVVLAPTGVAAINAGGVTIHSFFQMPFGPQIPGSLSDPKKKGDRFRRFSREKLNIIRSLDLLVIDEISMVRADLLDGIDEVLRMYRDKSKPFGGLQLLMIGDLQQLAPVARGEEWELLKDHYDTPFFFASKALAQSSYITIELKKIYRQSDQEFISLLNGIRNCDGHGEVLEKLNKRCIPGGYAEKDDGSIILTTHNYQAQRINSEKMNQLSTAPYTFTARIQGDFPEYAYPTESELTLKKGAQVMFVKNDSSGEKRYFNGKIGIVENIDRDTIFVKCDEESIAVEPDVWQNVKYGLNENSGQIEENVCGSFTQYPLKAAWAITIHKSQGLTFDRVVIDAGAAFAHGQVYVALSRCRSLEGLILTKPLTPGVLISSTKVEEFSARVGKNQPGEIELEKARMAYQRELICDLFDFSSMQKSVNWCLYVMKEHKESLLPHILDSFSEMASKVNRDVVGIAEKFSRQIPEYFRQSEDVQSNSALQDRLKKASLYFSDKLESTVYQYVRNFSLEVDNKKVRKQLGDALKRVEGELNTKLSCFEACRNGFSIKRYLEARAVSKIEKKERRPRVVEKREELPDTTEHMLLYNRIRAWRDDQARSRSIPEYMVLPRKTILGICVMLPTDLKELRAVHGMGKRKVENSGKEILEIVDQYCSEMDISREKRGTKEKDGVGKVPKSSGTYRTSLDLFNSGKSIQEIAAHRGLALGTIETHLTHYIISGKLSVFQFLSKEEVEEISEFFLSRNSKELTPAKNHFGEKFSYGELRMVVRHLEKEGKLNFQSDALTVEGQA